MDENNDELSLHFVAKKHPEKIPLLLNLRKNVNEKDNNGKLPIFYLKKNSSNDKYALLLYLFGSKIPKPNFMSLNSEIDDNYSNKYDKKNLIENAYQIYLILAKTLHLGPDRIIMEFLFGLPTNHKIYNEWENNLSSVFRTISKNFVETYNFEFCFKNGKIFVRNKNRMSISFYILNNYKNMNDIKLMLFDLKLKQNEFISNDKFKKGMKTCLKNMIKSHFKQME